MYSVVSFSSQIPLVLKLFLCQGLRADPEIIGGAKVANNLEKIQGLNVRDQSIWRASPSGILKD